MPRSNRRSAIASWLLAGLSALSAQSTVGGAATPAPSSGADLKPYLTPARLIDVGGRRLNLFCTGAGAPAVILEAGLGDDMSTWRNVQPVVARRGRVCAYDRAGMGFSDFASPPRDARAVARDLHTLLRNAGIGPPFVLVGSSLGGLYVVMYAKQHREDVAGLVLVDPSEFHNWDFAAVAPAVVDQLAAWRGKSALCLAAIRRGPLIPASTNYEDCVVGAGDVAPACQSGADACALAKRRAEHSVRPDFITDFVSEQQSWGAGTAAEILSDHRTFGSMPMIVLTGAKTFAAMSDVPKPQRDAAEGLWMQMHDRLAALSSDGKNLVVPDSGHVIQHDDPEAVTSAIATVVDQARRRTVGDDRRQ